MIGTLVRENRALQGMAKFAVLTIAVAFAALNVATIVIWADGVMPMPLFAALLWIAPAFYIIFGSHSRRCSPFDLGLPISARQLWLSHLIAVIVAGIALLVVASLVVVGGLRALLALTDRNPLPAGQFGNLAINLTAAFVLAVVVTQLTRGASSVVRRTWPRAAALIVVAAAGYGLAVLFAAASPVVAVAMLGAALLLVWWSFRNLPSVFDLAVATNGQAVARDAIADWSGYKPLSRGPRFDWFVWRTLSRNAHAHLERKMSLWILLPMSVAFGVIANIGIDDDGLFVFLFMPMLAYMLVAFATQPLVNTQMADSLPISRRTLLNVVVMPHILGLCLGYGVGLIGRDVIEARRAVPTEHIHLRQARDSEVFYIWIPLRHTSVAWNGEVPSATSPWGETAGVWWRPVFKDGTLKIYSPVGTSEDSTIDFVALQISRATETVYGEAVPADEIAARYLTVREDGLVVPKNEKLTIAADYPHLRPLGNGPAFPLVMGLAVSLGFLIITVYMRALRAGATKAKRLRAYLVALALAMALWILELVLGVSGLMDPDRFATVIAANLRAIGSSPLGVVGVWIFALAIVAVTYRFMLSRFERVEGSADRVEAC